MAETRPTDLPPAEVLLERYRRSGDVTPIGVLFDLQAPGLFRIALSICGDPAVAEDIVQETFLAALDGVASFEAGRPVGPWLVGILKNMARRAGRDRRRKPDPERLRETAAAFVDDEAVPALDEEERTQLRQAIDTLGEPYRAVALLRYVHGLPAIEIAHLRSEPPGTVRSLLSRARRKLRGRLRVAPAFLLVPDGVQGLASVRAAVMEHASILVSTSATALTLGGLLMGKKLLVAGTLVLLALIGSGIGLGLFDGSQEAQQEGTGGRSLSTTDVAKDEKPTLAGTGAAPAAADAQPAPDGPHAAGSVRDAAGAPIAGARIVAVPEAERYPIGPEQIEAGESGAVAHSGKDGRFFVSLDATRPAHVVLVEAPGYAPTAVRGVTPGSRLEFDLEPAAQIRGRVTRQDGTPVVGADVSYLGVLDTVQIVRQTTTGDDGRYRIEDLPARTPPRPEASYLRAWLLAEAPGLAPAMLEYSQGGPDVEAGGSFTADIVLIRGAAVEGRVLDAESGTPLANAELVVFSIEGMSGVQWGSGRNTMNPWAPRVLGRTTNDAQGRFRYENLPAQGPHAPPSHNSMATGRRALGSVAAMVPGYVAHAEGLPVARDGEQLEVDVRLWPAATVRGRVVDLDGRPVAGVSVSVRSEARTVRPPQSRLLGSELPSAWAKSGEDGTFSLEGVPALASRAVPAQLHLDRFTRPWGRERTPPIPVEVQGGEARDLGDVVFNPKETYRTFSIHVRTPAGHPIPEAGLGRSLTRLNARADADGVIKLAMRVLPDRPARAMPLVAAATGFAPTFFELAPDDELIREITLQPGGAITGRVLRQDGTPWPGVWVHAAMPDARIEEVFPAPLKSAGFAPEEPARVVSLASSGPDGVFVLRDLPPGTVHVQAQVTKWIGGQSEVSRALETSAEVGRTDLELVLPPLGTKTVPLEVVVVAKDDETPVDGASLSLHADRRRLTAVPAGGGRYRFAEVPPGTYDLSVLAVGLVPAHEAGVVVAETPADEPHRVALARGARVAGVVTIAPGAGELKDRLLMAVPFDRRGWDDMVRSDPLDTAGRYALAGLRPGRWHLMLVSRGHDANDAPRPVLETAVLEISGEGESQRDLHFVAGGLLEIRVADTRLPSAPWEPDSAEAQAFLRHGKNGRLSVLDSDGRAVAESRGIYNGSPSWLSNVALHPGTYTIRLALEGGEPVEQDAVVTAFGRTTVTVGKRP